MTKNRLVVGAVALLFLLAVGVGLWVFGIASDGSRESREREAAIPGSVAQGDVPPGSPLLRRTRRDAAHTPESSRVLGSTLVRGVVLSRASGNPIPACRVWHSDFSGSVTGDEVLSGDDGKFSLDVGGRADGSICAWAEGYMPAAFTLVPRQTTQDAQWRLELRQGTFPIQGIVVTPSREPIEGALVEAGRGDALEYLGNRGVAFHGGRIPEVVRVVTGPDGRFNIKCPLAEDYVFRSSHPAYSARGNTGRRTLQVVRAGSGRDLEIVMDPLMAVHAIAIDARTGTRIHSAGFAVMGVRGVTWDSNRERSRSLESDPTRVFVVATKFGKAKVQVSAPGYRSTRWIPMPVRPLEDSADPTRIALESEWKGPWASVRFRAMLSDGVGYTGLAALEVVEPGGRFGMLDKARYAAPLQFENGITPTPVRLPAKKLDAVIGGGGFGSAILSQRLSARVSFDASVADGGIVEIPVTSGALWIAVTSDRYGALSEYWLSLDGPGVAGSFWIRNTMVIPLQSVTRDGRRYSIVLLPPGRQVNLAMHAFGHRGVRESVRTPVPGSPLVLDRILVFDPSAGDTSGRARR